MTNFMKSIVFLLSVVLAAPAFAELRIRIEGGATGALPIAVVDFANETGAALPEPLTEIIRNDLQRSGLFKPVPPDQMLASPSRPENVKLQNWRALKVDGGTVDNLLIGRVSVRPGGGHLINFNLFDVFRGKELVGFRVSVPEGQLRSGAHRVADKVFEELTGTPGVFDTRIAYITASGEVGARRYALVVADADGYNPVQLIRRSEPLLSPAWSPDGTKLAYVRFNDGRTSIVVHDLRRGTSTTVLSKPGINGAPVWSPDGRNLAVALSFSGNAEIYRLSLASGDLKRLTNSRAIETEPTWSPDGARIAFTSDRAGKPQIYEMSASGGDARRLSFAGSSNTRAQYSPDGTRLALVNYDSGRYRVAVLEVESRDTMILSPGPLDESPSFAPNGAQLMYARVGGELATVTVDGRARSSLSQGGTVREPAWSPFPAR